MAVARDPEAELSFLRPRLERQRLGQFFTPEPLAEYLANLLIKSTPETVLDPAVGGGRLLRALPASVRRFGLDVDPVAVELARRSLPAHVELAQGDFLDAAAWPLTEERFDAIIANPPYVRHQRLRPEQKGRRAELDKRLGISLSQFADYYIYFFCEAVYRLHPGGKLAFVTPAAFLDARYGDALKGLLLRDGTIDEIVVFDQHRAVFDGARTAAAVTVFTKRPSHRQVVFREADFNGRVRHLRARRVHPRELSASASWSQHLPSRLAVTDVSNGVRLGDIVRIRRGLATGSNSFFCLTERDRQKAGIPYSYVRRVLVSGRNLPEQDFTSEHWLAKLEKGERVWLLWCSKPVGQITSACVRTYITRGEAQGVHLRTMCQRSKPWYAVENVDPPDFIFTYMSKRPLRFIENTAGARALTALLGGWLKPGVEVEWARSVLLSKATSEALTAAARDLGEGLRKIEPRRLADVMIPCPPTGVEQEGPS
jgi:methylase of polypeptide subunit release factors